jgi:hypothetical protein
VTTPGTAAAGKAGIVIIYRLNYLLGDQRRAGIIKINRGLAVSSVI